MLYLTLGLAIAFAIRSMGVLLVFTFLLVPAMTARLIAGRMPLMFILSASFGILAVPIGLYLAVRIDLPTGTTVAATKSLCALIASEKPIKERFEWALSPILSYSPSRFLTFRLQYKCTDRNYADDSDELMAQALFIMGYERPEPF